MTGRNNSVKAMLVFGVLTASLMAGAKPAFSQVSALDRLLEQAEASGAAVDDAAVVDSVSDDSVSDDSVGNEPVSIEPVSVEYTVDAAESEAAMLTLSEALDADGVADILATAESEAVEELEAVVEKSPGAEVLVGLESASMDSPGVGPTERALAATGAAFTVEASSVPALQAALNSNQALTQLYAADALWTLTGDSELVLPTLMKAAASGDADIQALAVAALGQMGNQASPAVPMLTELLNRNSRTRAIAQNALTVIRSGNPSRTMLGIIARESRRRVLPAALRAISELWR